MSEVRLHIETLDGFAKGTLAMARDLDRGRRTRARASIAFETMEGLLKVLTPNRWTLLRMLRSEGATSIRALAKALVRDYRGVHADVMALIDAGLVARDDEGLVSVPWSRITAEMALGEAA